MSRPVRARPYDLTSSRPDVPSTVSAEGARQLALNLRSAIADRSLRAAASACELTHVTLASILDGRSWHDLEMIEKLEDGLDTTLWPTIRSHP